MRIAIVGCGFVSDLYMVSLKLHPELEICGAFDISRERLDHFSSYYGVPKYETIEALLADPRVDCVINLTNPSSHYQVCRAALDANKHVYCEKPLAMEYEHVAELVALAESKNLQISSAPCSLLSETAQTIAKALREGVLGKVRAVYAEMDDGMVHLMPYQKWNSVRGVPWPYRDEFEVGCTLEHAGYSLTWLLGMFGPATSVTTFASVQIPDKIPYEMPAENNGPDFSVACVQFANGVVARLTCSIIAPHDHRLQFFGDEGLLWTDDTWFYHSPIYLRKFLKIRRKLLLNPVPKKIPLQGTHQKLPEYGGASKMDFARGIQDIADAVRTKKNARLSGRFSQHANELALAIHNARIGKGAGVYTMRSTFEPPDPMPWAK